ncbi:unnamed protein product, partial [Staurois parvus]
MDISQFPGRKNRQNAGRAQDRALGTKSMFYDVKFVWKKMTFFLNFQISCRRRCPYVPTSQGSEHRSRMPASAGGDGRGRCRGH